MWGFYFFLFSSNLFHFFRKKLEEKLSSHFFHMSWKKQVSSGRKPTLDSDVDILQEDLNGMVGWTDDSLLQFHPGKCKSMRITSRSSPPYKHGYVMKGQLLEQTYEEKDLGVIIDSKLSFDQHISAKVKTANNLVGLIRRSFEYLDKDMFKQLFTSIVRPHLEYAAPVWNPHLQRHITSIENVQRRASKLVPGLGHLSYMERLRSLRLPTLAYRRYRGDMIEMWKLTHGKYDEEVTHDFLDYHRSRARGHSYKVYKRGYDKGLNVRKYCFKNRVTDQWNCLPEWVVSAEDVNIFKSNLDKIWYGTDVYFNHETNVLTATSARGTRRAQLADNQVYIDLVLEA